MSHYRKPQWIRVVLWLMVIGIILAALVGVIVPYLPTSEQDSANPAVPVSDPTTTEVIIENPSTSPTFTGSSTGFDESLITSGTN